MGDLAGAARCGYLAAKLQAKLHIGKYRELTLLRQRGGGGVATTLPSFQSLSITLLQLKYHFCFSILFIFNVK